MVKLFFGFTSCTHVICLYLSLVGGLLLSLLATSSLLLDRYLRQINEGFSIGFTSVLIIVSSSQANSSLWFDITKNIVVIYEFMLTSSAIFLFYKHRLFRYNGAESDLGSWSITRKENKSLNHASERKWTNGWSLNMSYKKGRLLISMCIRKDYCILIFFPDDKQCIVHVFSSPNYCFYPCSFMCISLQQNYVVFWYIIKNIAANISYIWMDKLASENKWKTK